MANYKVNKPYSESWNGVRSRYEIVPDKNLPYPPRNAFVTNPYLTGVLDIRWDNPQEISENSKWSISGVNIYKSDDSEAGPFRKINLNPIEILSYRDRTNHYLVSDEDVLPRLQPATNAVADWVFRTVHSPIVKENSQNELVENPLDIVVKIDNGDGRGLVIVPAYKVNARIGEVYLITKPVYNPVTKKIEEPRLPSGPNGRLLCSYWYNKNFVHSDLHPRHFYKITTVAKDSNGKTVETKLDDVVAVNVHQIEKPHYIWKGIITKNRYLLEQFGERVKLFIRKEVGDRCINYSDTHQQAHNVCPLCFGTSFLGGYYGPFDIMIAPPEAEKNINLTDAGLRLNFQYESWMGPSPLIRTRDFIVRQNGERLVVGGVTPQGAKGAIFQQHFNLNYKDSKDIIYSVPINGEQSGDCRVTTINVIPESDDTRGINSPITDASPEIPSGKSERAETEKGRTIDFENVTW